MFSEEFCGVAPMSAYPSAEPHICSQLKGIAPPRG
jgi:hypothetical protein